MPVIELVQPLEGYKLFVRFQDGTAGEIDLSHLAGKGVFCFWDIDENFKKVHIDEESGAISWNEEIDIDTLVIYAQLKEQGIDTFFKTEYASN